MDQQQDEGSVGIGFALGFFLGIIGVIVAYAVIKKPLTQKGSLYGIGTAIGLGVVCGIGSAVLGAVAN